MKDRRTGWTVLIVANVLCYCVLSFYQTSDAAQRGSTIPGKPPFANSVQQRQEMVTLLRDIKGLLREQNAFLRSGELKVIVAEPNKAGPNKAGPNQTGPNQTGPRR